MFEVQYNEEIEAEIRRLEAQSRVTAAGHPEWLNACIVGNLFFDFGFGLKGGML